MLETDRLVVRRASLNDSDFFLKLLNEDNYIKNIRDSLVRSVEDARAFITNSYLRSYADHGFGLYVLETKSDGRPVGVCGFVKREGLDSPDLGFALLESETGKGYVVEAGKAVLDYGKSQLGMKKVYAITTSENVRSRNVLLKLGFHLEKQVTLPNSPKIFDLYLLAH